MNPSTCGYCGRKTQVIHSGAYESCWVECERCGPVTGQFSNEHSAVKGWNRSVGGFTPFEWDDKHTQPEFAFAPKKTEEPGPEWYDEAVQRSMREHLGDWAQRRHEKAIIEYNSEPS